MTEQVPRRALHRRSDSENNSQKFSSDRDSGSYKAYAVSTLSSGANSAREKKPGSHKRSGTDSSNAASTKSNTTKSKSLKSFRSTGSLYSLPPVPPLRIYKDRESMPNAAGPSQAATVGYTEGEISQPAPAFTHGLSILPVDLPSPPLSGGGIPPQFPPFPPPILKQPSSEFSSYYEQSLNSYRLPTPPPTSASEEYRQKSSAWLTAAAQQDTFAMRAHMNERSLRMVGPSERDSMTTDTSYWEDSVAPGGLGVRSGIRQVVDSRRSSRRLSQAESMEEKAQVSQDLPTWTSYFYGRGHSRHSTGETPIPQEKDESSDPETIGQALTSLTPSPDPRPRVRLSPEITEIPSHASNRISEPDSYTSWSAPHLDHAPFGRLEAMKGNRQVILFCLGFIIPVCWFIASFLPLPQPPTTLHSRDVEATIAQDLYTTRTTQVYLEQRWRNSRFWRRVNRAMSAVGLLVVIAIVVLVAVAATMGK
ncbi:hypothetical protein EX30DRAFT_36276 [Ascodesmis nigricans]|uniref:Serine-rich protein n=1 Tax=Ascodesmis nigricans TaxID=341454 RepID=A0A4S2MWW1_9PEZI|nr:hypothetical protein EX30DRAFT_36276 [Ascodesmis nigricans]